MSVKLIIVLEDNKGKNVKVTTRQKLSLNPKDSEIKAFDIFQKLVNDFIEHLKKGGV